MFTLALLLGTSLAAASPLYAVPAEVIEKNHRDPNVEEASHRKPRADSRRVAPGTWGGQHIRLEVSENGAELEFDCARGSLQEPLRLDNQGRFSAAGVFARESPGPTRVGYEPKARPASYSGAVRDRTMTLRVRFTDSGESIGTYTLEVGSPGTIRKCR